MVWRRWYGSSSAFRCIIRLSGMTPVMVMMRSLIWKIPVSQILLISMKRGMHLHIYPPYLDTILCLLFVLCFLIIDNFLEIVVNHLSFADNVLAWTGSSRAKVNTFFLNWYVWLPLFTLLSHTLPHEVWKKIRIWINITKFMLWYVYPPVDNYSFLFKVPNFCYPKYPNNLLYQQ